MKEVDDNNDNSNIAHILTITIATRNNVDYQHRIIQKIFFKITLPFGILSSCSTLEISATATLHKTIFEFSKNCVITGGNRW
jgi:hypothetical protein